MKNKNSLIIGTYQQRTHRRGFEPLLPVGTRLAV